MLGVCRGWQKALHLGRTVLPANIHSCPALSAIHLKMPSLSPTMTEGTIVKWLKNEGDRLEPGDAVCDIQTDKAVVSMEVDEEGVLAKIIIKADSGTIKCGEMIAVVAEDGEDWKEIASQPIEDGASTVAEDVSVQSNTEDSESATGSVAGTVVSMPSLSPTMEEGTIVKWYKAEGENIGAGDLLCDIQTDKAVVSMEADDDGVLAKILVKEGTVGVKVGKAIALTVEEGQDWQDVGMPADSPTKGQTEAVSAPLADDALSSATAVPALTDSPMIQAFVHPAMTGPATALLLSQFNIDPSSVTGSGPKGNIVKSDVLQYIHTHNLKAGTQQVSLPEVSAKPPKPQELPKVKSSAGYTDIELTNMRKVIAKRLTESKQNAPHGYSSATARIDAVSNLRKEYIKSGFKVSINDFVIKAVATALLYVPELNVNIVNEEPVHVSQVDISVAVATDAGLITPIVKDAASKSVQQISADVKELAGRAKQNKLKLDEFQGGTFTISNLGMFGISEFTAIINSPQAAILAVGGGTAVINPDTMKPETLMKATLSFDRRYIDEALAADFMTVYRTLMERPELLGAGFLPSVRLDRAAASIQ